MRKVFVSERISLDGVFDAVQHPSFIQRLNHPHDPFARLRASQILLALGHARDYGRVIASQPRLSETMLPGAQSAKQFAEGMDGSHAPTLMDVRRKSIEFSSGLRRLSSVIGRMPCFTTSAGLRDNDETDRGRSMQEALYEC